LSLLIIDIAVQEISQVDLRETPLDAKCGLIHGISSADGADTLFDVKLALTSFAARKKSVNLQPADESLTEEFVNRVLLRLWTGGKSV
jgi:hypothetical protein